MPQLFLRRDNSGEGLRAYGSSLYEVTLSGWTTSQYTTYDAQSISTETLNEPGFVTVAKWTTTGWTHSSGAIHHTTGNTNAATQASGDQASALSNAAKYRVMIKVNFNVAGTSGKRVRVKVGSGGIGTWITETGVHVEDLTCSGDTTFYIEPETNFDGFVDHVTVKLISTKAITDANSETWQLADFGDAWFLTNSDSLVFSTPFFAAGGVMEVCTENDVKVKAVCNFQDTLLLGGMSSSTIFASDGWADVWQTWLENSPEDILTYEGQVIDTNVIMWGTRAGGDVEWPFSIEMAMLGYPSSSLFDELKPMFIDHVRKGDIGFLPVPVRGDILVLKQLGDSVVAYSKAGIVTIQPNPISRTPRYIFRKVFDGIGIAGRAHVGGDEREHVFVDHQGFAWRLRPDSGPQRLNYSEFLSGMVDSEASKRVIISHDSEEQEHYIGNGTSCYVIGPTGAGEQQTDCPTTLALSETDGLIGPCKDLDKTSVITSNVFDMGIRDFKLIQQIELGYEGITSPQISVSWKAAASDSWTESDRKSVSPDGVVTSVVQGLQFKINIYGTFSASSKIDYVMIRWSLTGKRFIRGLYATA